MRGWIRGNWRHLMVGLLCTAIVISSTALYLTYRQPEVCSLCGSGKRERYQAPVILNLTTGQSNEMRIYDPDLPFSEYEIAPIQTTGTFCFPETSTKVDPAPTSSPYRFNSSVREKMK